MKIEAVDRWIVLSFFPISIWSECRTSMVIRTQIRVEIRCQINTSHFVYCFSKNHLRFFWRMSRRRRNEQSTCARGRDMMLQRQREWNNRPITVAWVKRNTNIDRHNDAVTDCRLSYGTRSHCIHTLTHASTHMRTSCNHMASFIIAK